MSMDCRLCKVGTSKIETTSGVGKQAAISDQKPGALPLLVPSPVVRF